jgi:hypothetical protein
MTDRGIKDEAFVRRALSEATHDMGRWIAHQDCFNGLAESILQPSVKAALVTSVAIFAEKYPTFTEDDVEKALEVKTIREARSLIDILYKKLPSFDEGK